jgi:hypothetical protein
MAVPVAREPRAQPRGLQVVPETADIRYGEVCSMKIGTEKILCATAVVGACALMVLATHHTGAEETATAADATQVSQQPAPAAPTTAPAAPMVSKTAAPAVSAPPIRANPPASQPSTQPSNIDPKQAGKLLAQLQTLRSQLDLWKLQHEDRMPDLRRFEKWQQFCQRTSVKGELSENGKGFGPYLVEPPRNALNNFSDVAMSGDDIKLTQLTLDRPVGFVMSLPSGRLFGTDPTGRKVIADATLDKLYQSQFADGSQSRSPSLRDSREDRLASLLDQLNTLQAQLLLYKLQHRDTLPDLVKFAEWQQLTNRTDATGKVSEKSEFGPYLRGLPRNPLTGDYRVVLTSAGRKTAKQLRDGHVGYVLDPRTTQLWAVDEQGKCIAVRRVGGGT